MTKRLGFLEAIASRAKPKEPTLDLDLILQQLSHSTSPTLRSLDFAIICDGKELQTHDVKQEHNSK